MRALAPTGRDAERLRARLRAEGKYDDVVVIEADHESVGVLFRDDVARGYGSLSYVRNPVPSAVKPGAFLRIWGGFGNLVLGVTVMVMPPLDALLSHYAIERSLPPAIEGEHLWLREP